MNPLGIFLAAMVLTAPLLVPLARVFFGTWAQFAEETGLQAPERGNDPRALWSNFAAHASDVLSEAMLDALGLFVAYVVVLGVTYHALAWMLAAFGAAG